MRPSLLVATAAALALVASWDDNGRPVPAGAIRDYLGLPDFYNLPAFLTAARQVAADRRRGVKLNDKELAKLAGVSAPTIAKWRPDFDRFADAAPDNFFPLGFAGVPDDPAMTPEGIEAECAAIADRLDAARKDRARDGERRARQTAALPVGPRAMLFRCALAIARHGWPAPDAFLLALAHALGIISPVNGRLLIDRDVLRGVGVPVVENPEEFRAAARLEGKWLRKRIEAMRPEGDGPTFWQAWEKASDDYEASERLHSWFAAQVKRLLDGGWLDKGAADVTKEAGKGRKGRSTVADWKKMPGYRRLVRDTAMWGLMVEWVWRQERHRNPRVDG